MKQCGGLNDIQKIKDKLPQFKVYIGDDHLLLEGLKQRADGIISVTSHLDYGLIEEICKNENPSICLSRYACVFTMFCPRRQVFSNRCFRF